MAIMEQWECEECALHQSYEKCLLPERSRKDRAKWKYSDWEVQTILDRNIREYSLYSGRYR